MSEILAIIYAPRWYVVSDPTLTTGSQIRIRETQLPQAAPEVIVSLKQDLEEGEPVLDLSGREVATMHSASSEAIKAVLKAIAINAGADVYVVLAPPAVD